MVSIKRTGHGGKLVAYPVNAVFNQDIFVVFSLDKSVLGIAEGNIEPLIRLFYGHFYGKRRRKRRYKHQIAFAEVYKRTLVKSEKFVHVAV